MAVQLNAFLKADLLIFGIFVSTKAVTCYRRATVEAVELRLIVVMAFITRDQHDQVSIKSKLDVYILLK